MGNMPPVLHGSGKKRRRILPWIFILVVATGVTAILLFLFFSGASSKESKPTPKTEVPKKETEIESTHQVDTKLADRHVKIRFGKAPRAGILFNIKTGEVLWQRKSERKLPIASWTKMMPAFVIVARSSPHERVKITKQAVGFAGSGIGALPRGKKVQLEALMNGLLLVSANDAAIALAQHISGSVKEFVALMNRRAQSLGLNCTRFTTPHGLEDKGNRSCARDLATLARANLSQTRIRKIARRSYIAVKFPIKGGKLHLANHNPLIRLKFKGATGLKTGYTKKSGRCIVATAKRGKTELGIVLLQSHNPYSQATKLLNKGFELSKGTS